MSFMEAIFVRVRVRVRARMEEWVGWQMSRNIPCHLIACGHIMYMSF